MKKLKVAIIGQGRSGRDIHGVYFRSERNEYYEVGAVVELDASRRALALEEYPGCSVYEDYRELYGRDDIDLVVNATCSDTHYSITKELLLHGKNVLVEKPFARNKYECDELIKIAEDKGVTLAVFQQTFLAPFYNFAKELITSGKIGDIQQISIKYNSLSRRWDWQTLQCKMAGVIYNTGPHPIGMALGFLGFDENYRVEYSKLSSNLYSGDGEDYAKIIITAPNKPVVDIEMNALDAYNEGILKFCGNRGTLLCDTQKYKMRYIIDGENPERPVVFDSMKDDKGMPAYCSENLITHEESGTFDGTAFDIGTSEMYKDIYFKITENKPMRVTAEMASDIINVIETVHAHNPLKVKF